MPIAIYKCSVCNNEYKSHKEAVKCENSHLTIASILPVSYDRDIYPAEIEVTFVNGEKKLYIPRDYVFYGFNNLRSKDS